MSSTPLYLRSQQTPQHVAGSSHVRDDVRVRERTESQFESACKRMKQEGRSSVLQQESAMNCVS